MSISLVEAELTVNIVLEYYQMRNPKKKEELEEFWQEQIGIVAPHNAQGRLIIRMLLDELSKNKKLPLSKNELSVLLRLIG